MKKILFFLFTMLALVSCQDQVQQAAGSYSYKISGYATVDGTEHTLSDEQGALEMIHISQDSALLTFNALMGPAYYTTAKIDDKQITILPYERRMTVGTKDYTVTASGNGNIYDETILITLRYNGDGLIADSLTLLCKKN